VTVELRTASLLIRHELMDAGSNLKPFLVTGHVSRLEVYRGIIDLEVLLIFKPFLQQNLTQFRCLVYFYELLIHIFLAGI